ncbi:unnamed protein product, partial [Effrenium voratum]
VSRPLLQLLQRRAKAQLGVLSPLFAHPGCVLRLFRAVCRQTDLGTAASHLLLQLPGQRHADGQAMLRSADPACDGGRARPPAGRGRDCRRRGLRDLRAPGLGPRAPGALHRWGPRLARHPFPGRLGATIHRSVQLAQPRLLRFLRDHCGRCQTVSLGQIAPPLEGLRGPFEPTRCGSWMAGKADDTNHRHAVRHDGAHLTCSSDPLGDLVMCGEKRR